MATQLNSSVPSGMRLTVAIIGNANAGKSALLNQIVGQDTAIVSAVAGTTTDAVLKPYELIPLGPVCFYDTAGLDDKTELRDIKCLTVNNTRGNDAGTPVYRYKNVIAGFRPRVTFMADSVRLSSDGTAVTLGLRSNTKWKIR